MKTSFTNHERLGPIPEIIWLEQVVKLNSKTPIMMGIVALSISKASPNLSFVAITPELLRKFCIHRASAYRALKLLEVAGLVKVKRSRGKSPLVSLVLNSTEVEEPEDMAASNSDSQARLAGLQMSEVRGD